jgi:hypothetical protein
MVYACDLRNLHYSPCGCFLFGDHSVFGTFRTIPLARYLVDAILVPPPRMEVVDNAEPSDVGIQNSLEDSFTHMAQSTSTQLILAKGYRHPMQSSNKLTLASPNGIAEVSTIRNYADGAVVLKRYSPYADDEKCLVYLPKGTDACTSVNILDDSEGNPDNVRMVLTTDFQDAYTWNNPLNRQSASIITRPVASIQQYRLPDVPHRIVSLLIYSLAFRIYQPAIQAH